MTTHNTDERRRQGRRSFIRWSMAAGAALGLQRWQVFEILEASSGKALAQDAACAPSNRSLHVVAGTGAIAWFNLLWPHNDIAAARNDAYAWHAIGLEERVSGTHKPLTVGPQTPWRGLPPNRQVTCMMAGTNETHTVAPSSHLNVAMNTGLFASCASIQTANPTLTPVIAVDDVPYRNAPGAPRVARVGSADDIVQLFNSAASREGGILRDPRNADLFRASYSAWLSMRAAANVPTMRDGHAAGTMSARLIGENLADLLRPTDADLARYGVMPTTREQNREFARGLIVAAKAFIHGLTSCVILPAFKDDPHGAFTNMSVLEANVTAMGSALEAFLADLSAVEDPTCGGSTIGENTVVTIHGDTPKNPMVRAAWPDGTPGNSNWCYVLGAGHLHAGWFGGVMRDGTVLGWNPTTGADDPSMGSGATSEAAAAAIIYAVAKGDMRRVNDFYRGADIGGVVNDPTT